MIKLKSPVAIVWEITSKCNFTCPHCRAFDSIQVENHSIEDRIVQQIIQEDVMSVNLSGGEPLLHNRLQYFVETLSKKNIDVGISTNGWLFEKLATDLVKRGLKFIQVSIDGDENLHDSFRGKVGSFKKAVKALELARSLGLRTQMNVAITSVNIDTLSYNIDLGKKIKVDRVFFRRVVPSGKGATNRFLMPSKDLYLKKLEYLVKISDEEKDIDICIDDPLVVLYKKNSELNLNKNHIPLNCGAGIKSLGILSNGEILPCIFLRHPIGNIMNNDLSYYWNNSEILQKLRTRTIDGCGSCTHSIECGGCRAFSGIFSADAMCPYCEENGG